MNDLDQYLVIPDGAMHMTFGGARSSPHRAATGAAAADDDETFRRLTNEATAAFWSACLKNDESARQWLRGDGWKDELGTAGTFECKSPANGPATRRSTH